MDEEIFWLALEYRLCHEFQGLPERNRRYWWCDGFIPEQYQVDSSEPKITGHVWIVDDQKPQACWQFTLFLDKPYASREEIDWSSLLPARDVTCWMAIDEAGKVIQIEPSAAVPDFPVD